MKISRTLVCILVAFVLWLSPKHVTAQDMEWNLVSETGPSARSYSAIAYDSNRDTIVLFGGSGGIYQGKNDTWEWNGESWEEIFTATTMPILVSAKMVFDEDRNVIVLFGGMGEVNGSEVNDTWEYDGIDWTKIETPDKPPVRNGAGMIYDTYRNRVVVFGGSISGGPHVWDMWEYDGANWYPMNPIPPEFTSRKFFGMAYDKKNDEYVVFGGRDDTQLDLDETWIWNETNGWSQKYPETAPPSRSHMSMVYDEQREKIVMFGGGIVNDPLNDTWEWDGENWQQIETEIAPSPRVAYAIAYNSNHGSTILFGGNQGTFTTQLNDTWIYGVSDPVLSLEPSHTTVHRGQELELAVEISDASTTLGYRIGIQYNPALITYVTGSATINGTSCELWHGPFVNDASSSGQLICTAASKGDPLGDGKASLIKFRMLVDDAIALADETIIDITFDSSLTSINEGDLSIDLFSWQTSVFGPNHQPSFDGGANQSVLEDAGPQEIPNWATNISAGPPYEASQTLWFDIETSNPTLFFASPTIDVTGTLRFTTAADAYGISDVTATLFDSGGTANGGINASTPFNFIISATPVNDAPWFIKGATIAFVNDPVAPKEYIHWATQINAGTYEIAQTLHFMTDNDQPALFSVQPAVDIPSGTLSFTPAADAHGVVNASVALYDDGGQEYGGIDRSATEEFKIISFPKYLWGDMNDNGTVGSVDASLILQYDVSRITYFPAFPPSEYPEYYQQYYTEYFPMPVEDDPFFTPSGDVNWDQTIATVDASLILQQYALLIDSFPADTNEDNWGPDYTPGGKTTKRSRDRGYAVDRELTASVTSAPDGKSWIVRFAVDDASELCGVKLGLQFDPSKVAVVEEDACLLVKDAMSLMATNASQEGSFILAGALGVPMDGSLTHPTDVVSVRFKWIGEEEPSGSVLVQVDERLSRLNDGAIPLSASSVKTIDLLSETSIAGWMMY